MKYDFETWTDRTPQGSEKWLQMHELKPDVLPDVVPLSIADMEFELAPEIRDGLKGYLDTVVLGYTAPTDSYYAAIISWLERRRHLHVEKDWIVPVPGVVAGMGIAIHACTAPADGVIILTPVYPPFYSVVEIAGRTLIMCELKNTAGEYTIDFGALEKAAAVDNAKAILLCSPHNPVGRVWTGEELCRIGDICQKHDLHVISDEIHGDLLMPGYEQIPFLNACPQLLESTVLLTAPSKTFNLAGMQSAVAIIPDSILRENFEKQRHDACMGELTTLGYVSTELAYTRADGWYEQMLSIIDGNRQMCVDILRERVPQAVVSPLQGTYLLWVDLRFLRLGPKELQKLMIRHDLFLDEGYIFGKGGEGFERINLAAPRSVLEAAMGRLCDAVQEALGA